MNSRLAAGDLKQRRIRPAGDREGRRAARPCRHRSRSAPTTAVVFSATLGVADEVITGALSFWSVSVTVIVLRRGVRCRRWPSPRPGSCARAVS